MIELEGAGCGCPRRRVYVWVLLQVLYQFFVCNSFNPQPLISHLTNSNGYGNLTPGSVDVSTLGTLLFPEPSVYPKLSHFGPPFVFNRLRTLYLSCGSFSRSDRLFSIACALFDKNTGGGIPPSSPLPHLRPLLPSHPLSVSTFRINTCESVSKQTTSSPFRINTYEKTGEGEGGTCSSGQPFGPEAFSGFWVRLGRALGPRGRCAALACGRPAAAAVTRR